MSKRVFIIHGWDGYPEEGIFPWLKKELQNRGFAVFNPAMPNPLTPKIEEWIPFLAEQVGKIDEETFFVGHSIGAQAVIRYLETLSENEKAGGVFLLAPWFHLTEEAFEDDDDPLIAQPWIETPIDYEKVKQKANKITAVFSDNDPVVPLADAEIFKDKLSAKIIVEHDKGHFSGDSGIKELPSTLEAVLEIAE